jgi:hypothetical protein
MVGRPISWNKEYFQHFNIKKTTQNMVCSKRSRSRRRKRIRERRGKKKIFINILACVETCEISYRVIIELLVCVYDQTQGSGAVFFLLCE